MLTSKQRAYLRSIASKEDAIFQVGKGGVNDNLIGQISDALKAREIVKITVLETSPESAEEAAARIAEATRSETVQIIGSKAVFFKRNPQNPKTELPKSGKKK